MQDKSRNTDLNISLYWPEFLALPPLNGLRGPWYSRWVILLDIGFDSLFLSVARTFHAIGFKHNMNSIGQSASPWGGPFLKRIVGEISLPWVVWATILVFQLLASFSITLANHMGNLCRVNISDNQPWSTESYALATSIHAMLRFRFPLWASSQTIPSTSKLSTVPLQLPLAPRCSRCINP